MAGNTIMTAKNTFGDGLLMDLAPDNTPATCLSNALNATLLTMNGNEFSLQNDMGNGRVETAYLPEGYVPVGTCEFGGIIYIVSYNPIINKSQIGCFPSPERNISSEEIQGTQTQFDLSEFIKTNDFKFKEVVNNSIKKVIYQNNLNPGDKFIVYSGDLKDKADVLSDFGNKSHILEDFPKQYKISVVAIEESGKINYLNSTLKWYDDYYINPESTDNKNKPDLSTYRNILNSGYSVFQSKVSGKLAILIELERIQGFSSTYEIYNQKKSQAIINDIEYQNYSIYTNFNWNTDNPNINPVALVAYDFQWLSNYSGVESLKKAGKYKYYDSEGQMHEGEVSKDFLGKDQYIKIPIYKEKPPKSDLSTDSYEYFKKYLDYNEIIKKYTKVKKITQQRNDSGIPEDHTYWKNLHHIIIKDNNKEYYDSDGNLLKKEPDNNVQSEKEDNIVQIDDFIINNYFKQSISRKLFDISIPYKDEKGNIIDQKDLILSFKIAPMMEYGALVDLAQTHYIDFSKIGSGEINLEGYKYYIGENLCTLQLDSSIYPEENKGVAGIELQFYDNQGLCATYNINNRVSYSGVITEYIPLNGDTASYKLSSTKSDGTLINHAGQVFTDSDIPNDVDTTLTYVYLERKDDEIIPKKATFEKGEFVNTEGDKIKPSKDNPIFYNDAGTLYSNMLYAIKIIYKYTNKNVLGEYDLTNSNSNKTEWRWLWTNTMFNQYYYNVKDFKDNPFELQLDVSADYYSQTTINKDTSKRSDVTEDSKDYERLGVIKQNLTGNIKTSLHLGLENSFNTFNLNGTDGVYNNIKIRVDIPVKNKINYTNQTLISNENLDVSTFLLPKYGTNTPTGNIYDTNTSYEKFQDNLSVEFDTSYNKKGTISYLDNDQNFLENCNSIYNIFQLNKILSPNSINFKINLINYNKFYQIFKNVTSSNVIRPLTRDYKFLQDLGIVLIGDHFYFSNVYSIFPWEDDYSGAPDKHDVILKWKVSDSGTIDLTALRDLGSMRHILEDSNLTATLAGYWIYSGSGTASRSQLVGTSNGNFMEGPTGDDEKNLSNTIQIGHGFFINLSLPYNRYQSVNLNNQERITTYKPSNKWNFFGKYPSKDNHNILGQLGFLGDSNGCWHLFNDYFVIKASNTSSQSHVNDGCGSRVYQNLPDDTRTPADCLVEVLSSMYTYTNSTQISYLNTSNIYYEYSTNYVQDIIYKTLTAQSQDNILINNTSYTNYLGQLKGHLDKEYNMINTNIKLTLKDIVKNLPLQLVINSAKQSVNNTYIDSDYVKSVSNIKASSGILQITDDSVIPINTNFQYYQLREMKPTLNTNANLLYLNYDSTRIKYSPKAFSVFNYDNESLNLKRSSPVGTPENYALVNKSERSHAPGLNDEWWLSNDKGCSTIYDLFKSECLIPGWQMVN